MKRKGFSVEQIVAVLKQAELGVHEPLTPAEGFRFRGLPISQARRTLVQLSIYNTKNFQ